MPVGAMLARSASFTVGKALHAIAPAGGPTKGRFAARHMENGVSIVHLASVDEQEIAGFFDTIEESGLGEAIAKFVTSPKSLCFGLVRSQALLGISCYRRHFDLGNRRFQPFLYQVVVRRDARSRGYGAALLAHGLEIFSEAGCDKLCLFVHSDNKARRLYEQHGFVTLGPLIWNRRLLAMERPLPASLEARASRPID
jgi:ribosomal protein S18 acetylase RimI-like enzyme